MELVIRRYGPADLPGMVGVWNQVVEEGIAFPQEECLDLESGRAFFAGQSYSGVAVELDTGKVAGLYIIHPNNVGRCGHICNASYAVSLGMRGRHVGEQMVRHCMAKGKELGFGILQFNAVVRTNTAALRLYEKLGFTRLGVIPGGFLLKDGSREDIIPHYITL